MSDLQFNGFHFAILLVVLFVGFVLGMVYGWLVADEKRERAAAAGRETVTFERVDKNGGRK